MVLKKKELERIKNQFAPRASDKPRGESAGGGTGTVAVDNDDVAARAAAANDQAAADVDDGAAAAAAAAPIAPNDHGSGGGEDVPPRGGGFVATFLESNFAGLSEVFLKFLGDLGVTSAATLDWFAHDKTFFMEQINGSEAPPLQKRILVAALKKRAAPRAPATTTQEPEPDAGQDGADRHGKRNDEATKQSRSERPLGHHRRRSSSVSDSDTSRRPPGHRPRDNRDRRSRSSDSGTSSCARRSRSKDRRSTHRGRTGREGACDRGRRKEDNEEEKNRRCTSESSRNVPSVTSSRRGRGRDRDRRRAKKSRRADRQEGQGGRSGGSDMANEGVGAPPDDEGGLPLPLHGHTHETHDEAYRQSHYAAQEAQRAPYWHHHQAHPQAVQGGPMMDEWYPQSHMGGRHPRYSPSPPTSTRRGQAVLLVLLLCRRRRQPHQPRK